MVDPAYFEVTYEINPFMKKGTEVDKKLAKEQWQKLKSTYQDLGFQVHVLDAQEGLPDMVFAANQCVSTPKEIILSNMRHKERENEVAHFLKWFKQKGLITARIESSFEGMGDLLWDYQGKRLFGGLGPRTDAQAYDEIEALIKTPITRLTLIDPRFYHLDTCLCIINQHTALYVPEAFSEESLGILRKSFLQLYRVELDEAVEFLACNAHSPDGEHLLIECGAKKLAESLEESAFKLISLDTSEFIKAGGSIFCLKNQGWF